LLDWSFALQMPSGKGGHRSRIENRKLASSVLRLWFTSDTFHSTRERRCRRELK